MISLFFIETNRGRPVEVGTLYTKLRQFYQDGTVNEIPYIATGTYVYSVMYDTSRDQAFTTAYTLKNIKIQVYTLKA